MNNSGFVILMVLFLIAAAIITAAISLILYIDIGFKNKMLNEKLQQHKEIQIICPHPFQVQEEQEVCSF